MIPAEIEEYFSAANKEVQEGLRIAHTTIMNSSAAMSCRLVYGVPFYYMQKRVCFLNIQKTGFRVGFCDGFQIKDDLNLLSGHDRKVVRHFDISMIDKVSHDALKYYVVQAIEIDGRKSRK